MPQVQRFLDVSQEYLLNEVIPAQKVHSDKIHEHAGSGRKRMIPSNNNNGCYMWLKQPHRQ